MLDSIRAEAYGTLMPLNQLANVTAPEAQLLQVTPFDPSTLQKIAAAIREDQGLGFNPSDDGRVIRVPVPALTEERRKQLVKQAGEKVEEALKLIRPALQADGGNVELVEVTDDGVVKVKLLGACHGCPMSQMTLKMGIEKHLQKIVPGVKSVVSVQ